MKGVEELVELFRPVCLAELALVFDSERPYWELPFFEVVRVADRIVEILVPVRSAPVLFVDVV